LWYKKIQSDLSSLFLSSSSFSTYSLDKFESWSPQKQYSISKSKNLFIYSYFLSLNLLKEVLSKTELNLIITKDIKQANIIVGLKKYLTVNLKLKKFAQRKKIPVYSLNRPTVYQIIKLLSTILE